MRQPRCATDRFSLKSGLTFYCLDDGLSALEVKWWRLEGDGDYIVAALWGQAYYEMKDGAPTSRMGPAVHTNILYLIHLLPPYIIIMRLRQHE